MKFGETIKMKEFNSASPAEYHHKENDINDLCTYSEVRRIPTEVNISSES